MQTRPKTDMIILHCSATPEGRDIKAKDITLWHKQRGFETIGYHYVIDLDGTIEEGRDIRYVGAHCSGKNSTSVGICYIGGVDENGKAKDTRTLQQKQAMYVLVQYLMNKYKLNIDQVHCHQDFSSKQCPCFRINQFRAEYAVYHNTKTY